MSVVFCLISYIFSYFMNYSLVGEIRNQRIDKSPNIALYCQWLVMLDIEDPQGDPNIQKTSTTNINRS